MTNAELDVTKGILIYPDGRMNTNGAARYLGLSAKTLAMMRCQARGPKFVKRGRVFYFKEDIDVWLNEGGRQSSTAQTLPALSIAA